MDPRCRVEMLGPLRLVRGDQAVNRFGTQKAAALLAFLALRLGPQPRERIIDAFWPDMDLAAGRNNLSTALTALRHVLEPPGVRKGSILPATHAHVGLDPTAVTTDVADFERLLGQAGHAADASERAALRERALALYRGEFQPGNYQDWAVRENERLAARRVEALDQYGADLEATGRYRDAAECAQQRVTADPYEETAHVALIRRHVRAGHASAAHEAHRKFDQFFRDEFGAPPSAEARQTITGLFGAAPPPPTLQPPPTPDASGEALPEPFSRRGQTSSGEAEAPAQTLPLPFWLSRFFGREADLARLADLLLPAKDTPNGPDLPRRPCRLVTLVGPGGGGKTRLAVEFARQAAERFGHPCVFVPLADLSAPAQIPGQIAQALCLPPTPAMPPLEQAIGFLRERDRPDSAATLLILDNLEHLLETDTAQEAAGPAAVAVIQCLLGSVGGLAVLCTSRQRLGLQGEQSVPLDPLPFPDTVDAGTGPDGLASLLDIPSVRLYVDRAQTVRPDFGLTQINAPAVAALCRMLEGSPLALELAASWVRLLPPRKMWERLSQGEAVPESRHADLPARHRSMQAALEWSWRLLPPPQRRALACLSVFRGGWTGEAAETVCGEPILGTLASLQEASLVLAHESQDGDVRYGLLETVRQFAGERLQKDGETEVTRRRHRIWCLALAQEAEPELSGPDQLGWLSRLEAEHDNLRSALDWDDPESGGAETVLRLSAALGRFWAMRGHLTEGRRRLGTAIRRAGDAPPAIRADALYQAGALANAQGNNEGARRDLEACLAIRREIGLHADCAGPLRILGIAARQRGDFAAAKALLTESLRVYQAAGDWRGSIGAITSLGNLAMAGGDLDTAQTLYAQSLPLYRAAGDRRGGAVALGNLGNVADARGNHAGAHGLLSECLTIYRELGDRRGCAVTLHSQGVSALKLGDKPGAAALLRESLTIYQELGEQQEAIEPLEALAVLMAENGQGTRAVRIRAATDALRQEKGIRLEPARQSEYEQEISAIRGQIGGKGFEAAWALGRAVSWSDALRLALDLAE